MDHLIDYFDLTEMDLRKTTDEVTEAMQSYVHKRLNMGYWVKDTSNVLHGEKLYRCVLHVNSYNLRPVNK